MRIKIRWGGRRGFTKRVVRITRLASPADLARVHGRRVRRSAIIALVVLVAAAILYKRTTDPRNARDAYDAGLRLMAATRYEEAALNFSRVLDLRPDFVDAYRMRGRVYMAEYSPEGAIQDFTKVLQFDPNDASTLVERGLAYLDLDKPDYPAAIADANRAIRVSPRLARAYNLRGVAERAGGDASEALADFAQAIRLQPSLENFLQRGSTYQILNRHDLAIADFTSALLIEPRVPDVYFARALSETAMGNSAAAKRDSDRGTELGEIGQGGASNPAERKAGTEDE